MASGDYLEPVVNHLLTWLTPVGWPVLTGRRTRGAARGGALTPYVGLTCSAATALSQIDLAVVRPDRDEVVLAIEIATRPPTPDRILGLAANILLADAVAYRGETYALADTHLLIAVVAARRGTARARLATLEDRLNWTATALARQGKPRLAGVRIATCPEAAGLPDLVLAEARKLITLPRQR